MLTLPLLVHLKLLFELFVLLVIHISLETSMIYYLRIFDFCNKYDFLFIHVCHIDTILQYLITI